MMAMMMPSTVRDKLKGNDEILEDKYLQVNNHAQSGSGIWHVPHEDVGDDAQ
jgi:hypothetical protein